jgi:acyl-CoA reductase-like NAD-dependent aldehyde dehydrogenase
MRRMVARTETIDEGKQRRHIRYQIAVRPRSPAYVLDDIDKRFVHGVVAFNAETLDQRCDAPRTLFGSTQKCVPELK